MEFIFNAVNGFYKIIKENGVDMKSPISDKKLHDDIDKWYWSLCEHLPEDKRYLDLVGNLLDTLANFYVDGGRMLEVQNGRIKKGGD